MKYSKKYSIIRSTLAASALVLILSVNAFAGGNGHVPGYDYDDAPAPDCCGAFIACGRFDIDGNRNINFNDIDPFVELLTGQSKGSSCEVTDRECPNYGETYIAGDMDLDGDVDFNDIDGFVYALTNGPGQC